MRIADMYFDVSSGKCRAASSVDCLPQAHIEYSYQTNAQDLKTFASRGGRWPAGTNKGNNHVSMENSLGNSNPEKQMLYRSQPIFDHLMDDQEPNVPPGYGHVTLPRDGGQGQPRAAMPYPGPMFEPLIPRGGYEGQAMGDMQGNAMVHQAQMGQRRLVYDDPNGPPPHQMNRHHSLSDGDRRNRHAAPQVHDIDRNGEYMIRPEDLSFKNTIKDLLRDPSWFPAWLIALLCSMCVIALIIVVLICYE